MNTGNNMGIGVSIVDFIPMEFYIKRMWEEDVGD